MTYDPDTLKQGTLQSLGAMYESDSIDDRDALLLLADVVRDIDTETLRNTVRAVLIHAGVPEERTWQPVYSGPRCPSCGGEHFPN